MMQNFRWIRDNFLEPWNTVLRLVVLLPSSGLTERVVMAPTFFLSSGNDTAKIFCENNSKTKRRFQYKYVDLPNLAILGTCTNFNVYAFLKSN